jgi:hypothetical protein
MYFISMFTEWIITVNKRKELGEGEKDKEEDKRKEKKLFKCLS